jgi:hypothetical protein
MDVFQTLPALRDEVKKWERKYQNLGTLQELKKKVSTLKHEMAWAFVAEKEKVGIMRRMMMMMMMMMTSTMLTITSYLSATCFKWKFKKMMMMMMLVVFFFPPGT